MGRRVGEPQKPAQYKPNRMVATWKILRVIRYDRVINGAGGWLYRIRCVVCGEEYDYYQKTILAHAARKSVGCMSCKGKKPEDPNAVAVTDATIISDWSCPQQVGENVTLWGQDDRPSVYNN